MKRLLTTLVILTGIFAPSLAVGEERVKYGDLVKRGGLSYKLLQRLRRLKRAFTGIHIREHLLWLHISHLGNVGCVKGHPSPSSVVCAEWRMYGTYSGDRAVRQERMQWTLD